MPIQFPLCYLHQYQYTHHTFYLFHDHLIIAILNIKVIAGGRKLEAEARLKRFIAREERLRRKREM